MSVCRSLAWSLVPHFLDPTTLGLCRLCRATPAIMATPSLRRLMVLLTAAGASSRAGALPPGSEDARGDFPEVVRDRPEASGIPEDRVTDFLIGRRWKSWFVRTWKRGSNY